ncbi:MAG: S8 family serine peptidase [Anaerolineae bacterium]|nr:S8 family serine peptidase [Anaerolineae bacterium]
MRFWTKVLTGIGVAAVLSGATGTLGRHSFGAAASEMPTVRDTATPLPGVPVSKPVPLRLRIGTFDPLLSPPKVPATLQRSPAIGSPTLQLVQFPGPIQDNWYAALLDAGLDVVLYVPDYTYLVWGTEAAVQALASDSQIRWTGSYEAAYALHPGLQHSLDASSSRPVVVQIYDHAGAEATLATIRALASEVVRPAETIGHLTNLGVRVTGTSLSQIAALADVITVEPLIAPGLLDEIQGQIVAGNLTPDGSRPAATGYLTWLTATVGFTTTPSVYPIIDITDDGIDDGDATPQHADFYEDGDLNKPDRLVYNANWTTDPTADGGGGHGNINAAIAGGYNGLTGLPYEDAGGYNLGLGINPFGRIAGSKVFGNSSGWAYPSYIDLVARSYTNGARIVSNSWGDTSGDGSYLVDDQTYDALVRDADPATAGEQPVTIIFSAGNSGYDYQSGKIISTTVGSPANAKNVITVGATESYRPTWTDGCRIGPSLADNANDIARFSSRGPTADGRVKPELVAPGTHVQGAASQTENYTGYYVCDKYYPSDQTLYAASSGTSHATPAIAGAASLLTYFYQDRIAAAAPSPAMVKAYLVNTARYLNSVSTGDTLPSDNQGYGAVDLGIAFDDTQRIVHDQDTVLHKTGGAYVMQGFVAQGDEPLRITLAWTDPPGPTIGAAYVNDLDLVVTVEGQTYFGNVFSGARSITGGSADPRNNLESVFLPAGVHGSFTITVAATNLAGDGVPVNTDPTDQDFALVCYNCRQESPFSLSVTPSELAICRPDTAVFTVTTSPVAGFVNDIALAATDAPSDTEALFTPNPVTAGDTSRLTVGVTTTTTAGTYRLVIAGTTQTRTVTTTTTLNVLAAPEEQVTLINPASGTTTTTASLAPLAWAPIAGATHYTVAVATDPGLSTVVYITTTQALTLTIPQDLAPDATYYWQVTGSNPCGPGIPSSIFSFTLERRELLYHYYFPLFFIPPADETQSTAE